MTYLFQSMEILLSHPRNFLDSRKIGTPSIDRKHWSWPLYQPAIKFWMIFLDYVQNALVGKTMRRNQDYSFPVLLVGLPVQSANMSPSSVSKIDITWSRDVITVRCELIVYYNISGNDFEFRFRNWNTFGRERTVDIRWENCFREKRVFVKKRLREGLL